MRCTTELFTRAIMTDEVSSIFKLVMLALYISQCRKRARRSMRARISIQARRSECVEDQNAG